MKKQVVKNEKSKTKQKLKEQAIKDENAAIALERLKEMYRQSAKQDEKLFNIFFLGH